MIYFISKYISRVTSISHILYCVYIVHIVLCMYTLDNRYLILKNFESLVLHSCKIGDYRRPITVVEIRRKR